MALQLTVLYLFTIETKQTCFFLLTTHIEMNHLNVIITYLLPEAIKNYLIVYKQLITSICLI